jgi:hypothetical protein
MGRKGTRQSLRTVVPRTATTVAIAGSGCGKTIGR